MATDDEELMPQIKEFRPLRTIIPMIIELLFITGLEVSSIILIVRQERDEKCLSYFILLYLHAAHWFITVIIDFILKYEHHLVRTNGYLEFYRSTLNHHRYPFYIVSLWTTTLSIIQTLIQHFYLDNLESHCLNAGYLRPLTYYCSIITLEFLLLFVIIVNYIIKVYQFNKLQPLPDVQREEWAFNSNQSNFIINEIGHGIQGGHVDDLLEKQADLIQYLREHNDKMNEKIMLLNAQLRARTTATVVDT
ncbi:transmembrane protein 192 [Chrysoperla carnea]|uniref:transmembrane protein 192 n=1 Tax=Chrysoperla carnea TaxID=189513 RepID=UPI001D082AAF|nr:transmembrane protein 192 [Chrysoperla carnea]